ncbi:MAG: hypothetical protein ACYSWS_10720 [Planctomycetota bacterium]
MKWLVRFEDKSPTSVEYSITVAVIAAVVIVTAIAVAGKVVGVFNTMNTLMP